MRNKKAQINFYTIFGFGFVLNIIVILFYLVGYLSLAPYPGFDITQDGTTVQTNFDPNQEEKLQPGDLLVSINGISVEEYNNSFNLQYWQGLAPGDVVPVSIIRDGQAEEIEWTFTGKTSSEFMSRFISPIWLSLISWGVGFTAFLCIRPMDKNWRMFILYSFSYSLSLISNIGPIEQHLWHSPYVGAISIWVTVPLMINFSWSFPKPLVEFSSRKIERYLWPSLYLSAIPFLVWDLLHPGSQLFRFGLTLSITIALIFFIIRYLTHKDNRQQIKPFLLWSIAGCSISEVLVFFAVSNINQPPYFSALNSAIILIWPFAFLYIIWDRRLPDYRFRANRFLATALYGIILLLILMMLLLFVENSQQEISTTANILIAVLIAMATTQTYPFFTRLVDQYIFRIPVSTKDLLQSFSKQLDRTKDTASISSLMGSMILPALLVRQSALVEFQSKNRTRVLDIYGVLDSQIPSSYETHQLIELGLRTIPPQTIRAFPKQLHWIRVVLPLIFDDEIIGVWLLGQRDPNDMYDEYVIDLLQALAQQATIALIHHRKSQRLTTLYMANIDRDEEERAKLARDLHDDTLNDLALLQRETNDPTLSDGLTKVIQSLRKTINGLRPEMLSYGLSTALNDLGDALNERQSHTRVIVQLDGEPIPIAPNVEQHLYRIVQQACENALRHSQSDLIRILGIITEKAIHLTVVDNGIGFNVDTTLDFSQLIANQHYGLAGMHERADLINANLNIQSSPEQGTRISIYWKNPQKK